MAGSAIVRRLEAQGGYEIVTRTHTQLDLTRQAEVEAFFATETLDQVVLAAGKVGGIHANNRYPATFIYENLMMEANIIQAA
ncbi:MAG: NAD-dependent epimerase/dehydratase family protein, partial [Pseudomonadota bacterium]